MFTALKIQCNAKKEMADFIWHVQAFFDLMGIPVQTMPGKNMEYVSVFFATRGDQYPPIPRKFLPTEKFSGLMQLEEFLTFLKSTDAAEYREWVEIDDLLSLCKEKDYFRIVYLLNECPEFHGKDVVLLKAMEFIQGFSPLLDPCNWDIPDKMIIKQAMLHAITDINHYKKKTRSDDNAPYVYDPEEVLRLLKTVISENIRLNAGTYLTLAENYEIENDPNKAYEAYINFVKLGFSKNETVLRLRGNYYLFEAKDLQKAINLYEKATESNPNDFLAHNRLSICHQKLGKYRDCIKSGEAAGNVLLAKFRAGTLTPREYLFFARNQIFLSSAYLQTREYGMAYNVMDILRRGLSMQRIDALFVPKEALSQLSMIRQGILDTLEYKKILDMWNMLCVVIGEKGDWTMEELKGEIQRDPKKG